MGLITHLKNSYYMPGVDERLWADVLKRVFYRRIPKFPRTIQIQTRTGCNGGCVFCPYEDSHNAVPKGAMSDTLFESIVDEIAGQKATRRISPYLMNEPFLDKTVVDKARRIKARVPWAKVVMTTNAGVLKPEVVDDILRDNPFHAVYISMQGIEKGPYEETMRGSLVFEVTKENVEYLIDQRQRRAPGLKIVVTMIKTRVIDAEAAVAYWKSRGVESKYTVLENRGGNLPEFDSLNLGSKRVFKDCTRLFKHAYILFNGDMVLCCTDYYQTMILGNVADSSIEAVWNSPRATKIRRDFLRGDFSENPLCRDCYVSQVL